MKLRVFGILLAFLAVNILGFSNMAHESHLSHHACVFSFSSNCAQVVDPINSAIDHLASLQSSLQANLGRLESFSLLLLTLFSIVSALILAKLKPKIRQYLYGVRIRFFQNLFEFKTQLLAWLSILNKRDPSILALARA